MIISVIGTGHVGLVTGAGFSEMGHTVICIDQNQDKITSIIDGSIPIYEPSLDEIVSRNKSSGRLHFTTDLAEGICLSDVIFIAVDTPQLSHGQSDLSQLESVTHQVAKASNNKKTIVIKSTVPVSTCRRIDRILRKYGNGTVFNVVSNPEFLREGKAVYDFMNPDRIVLGTRSDDKDAKRTMMKIYEPFEKDHVEIIYTTLETSELIKYSANAFLATKVAFINEMANLCDAVGANITELARGIGLDNRIGSSFLKPGPGYGGSCFPKDTLSLTVQAQEANCPVRIIESVINSNSSHIRRLGRRVSDFCAECWNIDCKSSLLGKKIAVLGLSFKANTDDIRSAASTVIIPFLIKQGAKVMGFDPVLSATEKFTDQFQDTIPTFEAKTDLDTVLWGADVVLVLTEWEEIAKIDWLKKRSILNSPIVVDFRNLFNPDLMRKYGYHYASLGRP